jgi:hypothetical protein
MPTTGDGARYHPDVIWGPFLLALALGLVVSAGLYFAYMWPQVEPLDEDEEPKAAVAPAEAPPSAPAEVAPVAESPASEAASKGDAATADEPATATATEPPSDATPDESGAESPSESSQA